MTERLWARLKLWLLPATLNVMPRGNVHMVNGRPWTVYGMRTNAERQAAQAALKGWRP